MCAAWRTMRTNSRPAAINRIVTLLGLALCYSHKAEYHAKSSEEEATHKIKR